MELILLHIASITGEEKDSQEISEWISRTEQNFYKHFAMPSDGKTNVSDGLFYDYDVVIGDRIIKRTVSSLDPIYTGLLGLFLICTPTFLNGNQLTLLGKVDDIAGY